jgi:hypothetical protein
VFICVSLLALLGNSSVNCIPHNVRRQRLGYYIPAATNTLNNIEIVVGVVFYAVRIKDASVGLRIPLTLLRNNSVKTFPRDEELLEASVSMRSMSYQRKRGV